MRRTILLRVPVFPVAKPLDFSVHVTKVLSLPVLFIQQHINEDYSAD